MPTKIQEQEHSSTTTDAELALNGGYEYGDTEFVPADSSATADVDPATIAEINEVAGDLLDKNPNVRKRFLRLLAAGGGAVALSFLLAACAPNGAPTTTPTHAATGTPSPEATHNPDVFERTDPLPADLA